MSWFHVFIIFTICWLHVKSITACNGSGWFGSDCKYKCHCENDNCNRTGHCISKSKCLKGWFGKTCQYQDLMTIPSARIVTNSNQPNEWLVDRDDMTCNTDKNLKKISVNWNTSYWITWLQINFDTNSTDGLRIDRCENMKKILINKSTILIKCDPKKALMNLSIQGKIVKSICSLYISGGMNISWNVTPTKSVTYETSISNKVVDGNTNEIVSVNNSIDFDKDSSNFSSCTLIFDKAMIANRFLIFNRDDCCADQHQNFTFQTYGASGEHVYNFTHYKTVKQVNEILVPIDKINKAIKKVTINSNTSEILTLCELEAYGECDHGKYGEECQRCPGNCSCEGCNNVNGYCFSCRPGYTGHKCRRACTNGTYGMDCLKNCSRTCSNQNCGLVDGHCLGCEPGYHGIMCENECLHGTFGMNCINNCSSRCNNQSCNHINGQCQGCEPGYHGLICEKECLPGTYGMECLNNCTSTCSNQSCNHINGHCQDCEPGYEGHMCEKACITGTYGMDCLNNCSSTCTNQRCNPKNGQCQGCEPGYHGPMCENECLPGTYGMECLNNCTSTCSNKSCNHISGQCQSCELGYRGQMCHEVCETGKFGQDCQLKCPANCANHSCNNENGNCFNCKAGYQGLQCHKVCQSNTFGEGCLLNCSVNCVADSCYPENGTCHNGCKFGFEGKMCNITIISSTSMMSDVVFGSIIPVLVLLTVIMAGVLLRRFRNHTSRRIKTDEQGLVDLSTKGWEKKPLSGMTNNNEQPCLQDTSMSVMEFNNFMTTQNLEYFEAQFKSIPEPQNVSMEVAQSVQNKTKNRYKNICPYDHSRVRLLTNGDQNEADYINASYIKGHNDEFRFIASQGPTKSTLNDFVLMIWEKNVDNVVMLTNVIEEGKVKCDQYWPDTGEAQFGEITVKLKSVKTFADYIIRSFEMFKKDKEMIKKFTQFHFTSWPDKGVPFSPWSLVEFLKRISAQPTKSLVVVHCSAGVGRTGTFIGLDNVIRQAQETGRVDFFKTVSKMRKDRILMIQTAEQYLFIHKAAQAAIVCINTNVTPRNISDVMRKLEDKSINCKTKLEEEFKGLCTACESFVNDTRDTLRELDNDGNVYENIVNVNLILKNRYPSIIPKQHYRPYLSNESEDMGDYINAVCVPGFYKKDSQFLTQLPLPTTVVDFWRLVSQYSVSLIVAFEIDSMENDTTFGNYLPVGEDKSLSCPPYQIISTAKKEEVLWEESRLDVNKGAESRSVIHIKCLFTDLSPKNLLSLVKHVRSYDREVQGTKLYTCRNGAYFSGLICVLLELLDRIENDGYVSVPILVGGIKSIRMEVIPTLEQYRVIYDMLVSNFQSM